MSDETLQLLLRLSESLYQSPWWDTWFNFLSAIGVCSSHLFDWQPTVFGVPVYGATIDLFERICGA